MRSSVGYSAFHDVATLSVIPVSRRREALSAPIGLAAHFIAGETGTCKHQLYILSYESFTLLLFSFHRKICNSVLIVQAAG